jgi:NO-binding membrane sensor protein with MHYT domain/nitrogen-specific signal transduction histidine kinase
VTVSFLTSSGNAALSGVYDYSDVARSVLIAIAASYAALDLTGRVTVAEKRVRLAWLSGGATAMGIGIWAMHFKGMLAFHLPVPVAYDRATVLASLLVAILASAFALFVASRGKMGRGEAVAGSVLMGGGIAGMHYIGMTAMRLPAVIQYSPLLVTGSVLLAILFSLIALRMAFGLREETKWSVPRRLGSATVMGAAVSAMHYTGMAAASFIPASPPDLSHAVSISPYANNGIGIVTLIVIVAAVSTSSVDKRASTEAQRRAEEALREAHDEIARVTRVQAMGELAAAIAHEVNQPLTAVVTNSNFCLRQLDGAKPNLGELREAIAEIVIDGTRASAIISRIRALFMKRAADRVELDINEIIRQVAVLVRSETLRSRISLLTDLAADLRVLGDRVQLQQVFINLIMNGIEAVRTTERPREIRIKSARHPDGVLVQVQDSGPGIDPAQADRIFEPFFTTKPEGIGMGLAISRSIVESHGGRLWAVAGSNGALFEFTLPTHD